MIRIEIQTRVRNWKRNDGLYVQVRNTGAYYWPDTCTLLDSFVNFNSQLQMVIMRL